MNRLEISSRTI